jgi:26S proteasome regulatory subunit T6
VLFALQVMGKNKVLVKVHPEGKYVVDIDKDIDIGKLTPGARVALKNDSYTLHLCLPTKVDPLVSLMKVEKVPDSTYDMIGGADQQIKEIKEVCKSICMQHVAPQSSSCCLSQT